jgi:hypothetical protein
VARGNAESMVLANPAFFQFMDQWIDRKEKFVKETFQDFIMVGIKNLVSVNVCWFRNLLLFIPISNLVTFELRGT